MELIKKPMEEIHPPLCNIGLVAAKTFCAGGGGGGRELCRKVKGKQSPLGGFCLSNTLAPFLSLTLPPFSWPNGTGQEQEEGWQYEEVTRGFYLW
jgi:hypothetical protein